MAYEILTKTLYEKVYWEDLPHLYNPLPFHLTVTPLIKYLDPKFESIITCIKFETQTVTTKKIRINKTCSGWY